MRYSKVTVDEVNSQNTRILTDELAIFGESDITLNNTCPHQGGCLVGFDSVFGILHAGAPMADGEI